MYKDFEQKNRHRPIKITDVAIEKVPEVSLSGFTKEESHYIQEQHKFLLRVAKEDNNSGEVGILMDIINWDAWLIMGKTNAIETRDNPEAYQILKGYRKNALEYYFELAIKKYIKCKNNGEMAMRELLKNSKKIGLSYQSGGKKHG